MIKNRQKQENIITILYKKQNGIGKHIDEMMKRCNNYITS